MKMSFKNLMRVLTGGISVIAVMSLSAPQASAQLRILQSEPTQPIDIISSTPPSAQAAPVMMSPVVTAPISAPARAPVIAAEPQVAKLGASPSSPVVIAPQQGNRVVAPSRPTPAPARAPAPVAIAPPPVVAQPMPMAPVAAAPVIESYPAPAPMMQRLESMVGVRSWSVAKGGWVSDALRSWAVDSGWSIIWMSGIDYRIAGNYSVDAATFEEAADKFLRPLRDRLRPPIDYRFYLADRQLIIRSPSDELGVPRY
jgi:hypothetical protein